MNYSLVVIGCNDGTNLLSIINDCSDYGNVLLVEPVPWLNEILRKKFQHSKNIHIDKRAISAQKGSATFYAPRKGKKTSKYYSVGIGSLKKSHISDHGLNVKSDFEEITVATVNPNELFDEYEISTIDTLIVDVEGLDAEILSIIDYDKFTISELYFEYKHSDGTDLIGKNLGHALIKLDEAGYYIKALDKENIIATKNKTHDYINLGHLVGFKGVFNRVKQLLRYLSRYLIP
jgi:FkbM family methyltransferase